MARILLVEDDPDQLDIRRLLLEGAGHVVCATRSTADALVAVCNSDLIVMDLVPGCDDFIARAPATTRVIVLSGRDPSAAMAARSACVLQKPCPTRNLMAAIARVCQGA